jgi:hypothetical protein
MKTAVEWIEGYLKKFNYIEESLSLRKAFEQAKEMEKEQILNAFENGEVCTLFKNEDTSEQYYNKTFKSELDENTISNHVRSIQRTALHATEQGGNKASYHSGERSIHICEHRRGYNAKQ